jgi:hypothetical protein
MDGDYSYHGVSSDIKFSSELVKNVGIVCGDNLERQSHQVDAAIAKERPHLDKILDKITNRIFHKRTLPVFLKDIWWAILA